MTNEITQADRDLLAAEYEKATGTVVLAKAIRGGKDGTHTESLRAIAAARRQAITEGMVLPAGYVPAYISDNDLLKLHASVDEARNIRMSTNRSHLRVHRVYIPALAAAGEGGA